MPLEPDNSDATQSDTSNDGELTPDSLQEKLNAYRKAFEEEFELKLKSEVAQRDPSKAHEYLADFFKQNLPFAAAQVAWLAQNAESESVKLAASKYVIEHANLDSARDGDPIRDILEQLAKNDDKEQPANKANENPG